MLTEVGLGKTMGGPKVRIRSLVMTSYLLTVAEGDKWAYSFDVVHDIPELIKRRGGNASFVRTLDEHFDGGHNDHSNEVCRSPFFIGVILNAFSDQPSHHIPYLYALAGAAYKTQERVREIAKANYNNTPTGLSGVRIFQQLSQK